MLLLILAAPALGVDRVAATQDPKSGTVYISAYSFPTSRGEVSLFAFQPDGTPLASFGDQGRVVLRGIGGENGVTGNFRMLVDLEGRLVAVAQGDTNTISTITAYRFLPDGRLDPWTGSNGTTIVTAEADDISTSAIALDRAGNLFVAYTAYGTTFGITTAPEQRRQEVALIKLRARDFSRERSFGTNGIASHVLGAGRGRVAISVLPSGAIHLTNSLLRGLDDRATISYLTVLDERGGRAEPTRRLPVVSKPAEGRYAEIFVDPSTEQVVYLNERRPGRARMSFYPPWMAGTVDRTSRVSLAPQSDVSAHLAADQKTLFVIGRDKVCGSAIRVVAFRDAEEVGAVTVPGVYSPAPTENTCALLLSKQ